MTSGTCQFIAYGLDYAGNHIALTPTWSVLSGCGSVSGSGLFTACASPGGPVIEATVDGEKAYADMRVLAPGVPAHLVFLTQPGTSRAGAPIAPPIKVAMQDAAWNAVTSFNGPIYVYFPCCGGWASLTGTTTVNAVNGVSTFGDLAVGLPGGLYYSLEAGAAAGTDYFLAGTGYFNVLAGTPAKLAFTNQPAAPTGPNLACGYISSPAVQVQDSAGTPVVTYPDTITLRFGSNPSAATFDGYASLSGTTDFRPFSNHSGVPGLLVFGYDGLHIDKPGLGYTFVASAPGLVSAETLPFDVQFAPNCPGF